MGSTISSMVAQTKCLRSELRDIRLSLQNGAFVFDSLFKIVVNYRYYLFLKNFVLRKSANVGIEGRGLS